MNHRHALRTRQVSDGERRSIFVIETDLMTNPADPGFDADAYRDLEKAAQEHLKLHPNLDDFRIRPFRKDG